MRWKPDAKGRLCDAAIILFSEQGYDGTTVAAIAEAAGLTKRTFFRYFTDKREVLFDGSSQLRDTWIGGIEAKETDASPMSAVLAGLDLVAEMFEERLAWAKVRSGIIASHGDLQERELIKLQNLAGSIAETLIARGIASNTATLSAQAGITVFHVAFDHWIQQDNPTAMKPLIKSALKELHAVTG